MKKAILKKSAVYGQTQKYKNTYEAPVTEFIEMIKQEGICSGSQGDPPDEWW